VTGRRTDRSGGLRWYPRSWRDRYGDDVEMFLQDRYGTDSIPLSARLSMVRCGAVERLRAGGVIGTSVDADMRVRSASLVVLCAWGIFVVAGAAFANYSEHWPLAIPRTDHWLQTTAMGTAQVAALSGFVILIVAAMLSLPAMFHLLRSEGWRSMWAQIRPAVISMTVAGAVSVVIVAWNHHLGPSPNATAPLALRVTSVFGGFLVVGVLAVCSATAVAIVYRLHLSHRVTRLLGILALAMTGVLVVIFASALTWWITTAVHAPWFFGTLVPRSQSSPAPLVAIVLGLMMLAGLVLAGFGTTRITTAMARSRTARTPTQCS
jgi:hypothetical protein